MTSLTSTEIRLLLDKLSSPVVVAPSIDFPFTITTQARGYSSDPIIGQLQAKLSIMLEVAISMEERK